MMGLPQLVLAQGLACAELLVALVDKLVMLLSAGMDDGEEWADMLWGLSHR